MTTRERGQVVPLLVVVIAVGGFACLAAGRLGGAAVARARAVTAADAAALSGAAAGRQAAEGEAARNGARLVRYERIDGDTRVRVTLGGARAVARARPGRPAPPTGGPAPGLRAALARAAQLLGEPVPAVTTAAAGVQPGDADARHRRGLAVDVVPAFVPRLVEVAARAGLCQPYPRSHPEHFQLCR